MMRKGRYFEDHAEDEERPITTPSKLISRPMPSVIDTSSLRAVRRRVDDMPEPEAQPRFSRRDLLSWGGAALAAAVGIGAVSQTKQAKQAFAAIAHQSATAVPTSAPVAAPIGTHLPFGYFHAFFEVNSPAEVDAAAALGVNYTITYYEVSWDSANPDTDIGKALLRHGMKTFVNLEYPFLKCPDGYGHVSDLETIKNLVYRFKDSPLTAGYWIKDDDCTFVGDEAVALVGLYNIIREIDTNPTHLIVPGFGDAGSVYRNYAHGCADLMGFYPYPAYSRGPAKEVPDMLRTVRERTPSGVTPPPFMGIYQDFATPPIRPVLPVSNVVAQVKAYMDNGAAGVAGFGWEAPNETHIAANDPVLRQAISAVTQWLGQNGYGSPATK